MTIFLFDALSGSGMKLQTKERLETIDNYYSYITTNGIYWVARHEKVSSHNAIWISTLGYPHNVHMNRAFAYRRDVFIFYSSLIISYDKGYFLF